MRTIILVNKISFNKILLLVVLCLVPSFAFAAQAGKVELIVGTVQILGETDLEWNRLKKDDPVMTGDVIRTLKKSKIKLSLVDGSFLLLTENSKTKIEDVAPTGKSFFRMFAGKLRAIVKKVISPGSTFSIRTQTAIVGVKGTDFVVILRRDATDVGTADGSVLLRNVNPNIPGEVTVERNHVSTVTRTAPPTPPQRLTEEEMQAMIEQAGLSEEELEEEAKQEEEKKEEEAKQEEGTKEEKVKEDETIKEPEIEEDEEGDIEKPEEIIEEGKGIGDTEFVDEKLKEPEIEDTGIGEIRDPPQPPPF
jgi:hypothetical protein